MKEDDDEDGVGNQNVTKGIPLPLPKAMKWLIEDDQLSDDCWNSEMREVQL